jgi:NHL repeat
VFCDTDPCSGVLRPTLTYSIPGTNVRALTAMDNQLFVTRLNQQSTDQISIYDTSTFQFLGNITVDGASGQLYGLTADPTNNVLYVSDYDNFNLYKVNLTVASTTRWSTAAYPAGLSLNSARNVVVAFGGTSNKIQEFTSNGTLVREVSDTNNLYQVMDLNDGTYVVVRNGPMYGVCLLSSSGQTLRSYGSTGQEYDAAKMSNPSGLAVDKQGFVLVVDSGNNRILAFDPTLSTVCYLPLPFDTVGEIYNPWSIWLDESRGRLYVSESSGQRRLLVFDNLTRISDLFSI